MCSFAYLSRCCCFSAASLWCCSIDSLRNGRPAAAAAAFSLNARADWRLALRASLYREGLGTNEGLLFLKDIQNMKTGKAKEKCF